MNLAIHLGCAIAGFMTLKPGGTFIAKQYTFFQTESWQLIIYYASLFETFRICKPITSRPYNSEIYLVGTGFKGLPAGDLEKLLGLLDRTNALGMGHEMGSGDVGPFPILFCQDEVKSRYLAQMAEILRANDELFGAQTASIYRNVSDYYKTRDYAVLQEYEKTAYARNQGIIDDWLRDYPVRAITRDQWIPGAEMSK